MNPLISTQSQLQTGSDRKWQTDKGKLTDVLVTAAKPDVLFCQGHFLVCHTVIYSEMC